MDEPEEQRQLALPTGLEPEPPSAFVKSVFVRDLAGHVNLTVTSAFLVRAKETRFKKTGEPYLSLLLGDRTGEVEARMWDNLEALPAFERDDFLKVRGLVQLFRSRPQLSLVKLRRLHESEVDAADYFPRTTLDVEQMFAEVCGAAAEVRNPHLRALLEAVLSDPEIAARLKRAPAAKTIHHAYLGGLLEHIVSLCGLCRMAATHYPSLDPDLLIAAAVLHDLGKIGELEYARSISYTTEGKLLGHIVMALRIVHEKLARLPDFPENLRVLVEHLIVSHHGELEFGSPREPMFAEALVFHFLDNLDSKVNSAAGVADALWTAKNPALGRPLLAWRRYLEPEPGAAGAAAGDGASAAPADAGASEASDPPGGNGDGS